MNLIQKRYSACIIDFFIIAVILAVLSGIPDYCLKILMLSLYISKDVVFRNASIGKKIVGLMVITRDGMKPSFFKLLLRNVPTIILIAYEMFQLQNGKIRIGDEIAKTTVVEVVKGN